MHSTIDKDEVRRGIVRNFEAFCTELIGADRFNKAMSSPLEMRFGSHGSLACDMRQKRGLWHDHETSEGGDGFALIEHCLGIQHFPEQLQWAADWLQIPRAEEWIVPVNPERSAPEGAPERAARALRIWKDSGPIDHPVAQRYFETRALSGTGLCDLRFNPCCPAPKGNAIPAIVSLFRNIRTNEPVAIHRTFLKPDGSGKSTHPALDRNAKWSLGPVRGAAIKLSPDDEVTTHLSVSEGIENGASAMAMGLKPLWVLGSSGPIKRLECIPGIEHLTIVADADTAGREAARECASRWSQQGVEVKVITPRIHGQDANDVLKDHAPQHGK